MSSEAAPELLACPFCGGNAKRFTIGDDEPDNAGGDVIVCERCGASSHVEFGYKENLVSSWNTRLASASAPAGEGELPENMPGHWDSAEGREIAVEYAGRTRESLMHGDKSDLVVANGVFLVDRYDFELIVWQTAAKERIRWLSAQLAMLTAAPQPPVVASINHESALFDVLEALKPHFPDIAGGFARGTGGVDLPFILAALATQPAEERMREAAREVLSHRVGEQPTRGWLRDNDASRTALTDLAAALKEPRADAEKMKPLVGGIWDACDYQQGWPEQQENVVSERERVARIIDRPAWKLFDVDTGLGIASDHRTAVSLQKADAILATLRAGGEAREAAQFLSDRLDSLEWMEDDLAGTCRDYFGHVEPAHDRLKAALAPAAGGEGL